MEKLLPSQHQSARIARKIRGAFLRQMHKRGRTVFEHGHWWIDVPATGAQYDACDDNSDDGFSFEQVTPSDDE